MGMLVLLRREDEIVKIGDDIEVTVVEIRSGAVRLGFKAPKDVSIGRVDLKDMTESQLQLAMKARRDRREKANRKRDARRKSA